MAVVVTAVIATSAATAATAAVVARSPRPSASSVRPGSPTTADTRHGVSRSPCSSLVTGLAACFVLRFAYQGLEIAEVGSFVGMLVVVMFAVCGAIAFRATWEGFTRRPADPGREESLRGLRAIGFIGSLAAYFLRSLTEAPGEGLRRREYEAALVQYERRRTARTGNPAARRAAKGAKRGHR